MARLIGRIFRGILGPLKLRAVAGKQVASTRTKKGTLKKTPGMIKAADTFGMASALASKVRLSFKSYSLQLVDAYCCSRLMSIMAGIVDRARDRDTRRFTFNAHSFDPLGGFDFNTASPLRKWLLINPKINFDQGKMKISWPEVKTSAIVKFPAKVTFCKISMAITFFRLEDGYRLFAPISQHLDLNKNQADLPLPAFEFELPDGCLCVLGLFLSYYTGNPSHELIMNSVNFNPSGIAAATITPGIYEEAQKFTWVAMDDLKFE